MKVESLDDLRSAFADWRKTKKYRQEAIPARLLARAQQCASRHGAREVARATGIDRSRLLQVKIAPEVAEAGSARKASATVRRSPEYSRLNLSPPSVTRNPVAELETGAGVKLRLFEQTPEMLGLLRALCGVGGMR
ncbi:MAG: hypothetical protein P8X82_08385 [Gemmatimonadales bacterium]